jgi:hypothetical protein
LPVAPRPPVPVRQKSVREALRATMRDPAGQYSRELNGEIFYSLREAEIIIERWRHHYNKAGRTARSATGHQRRRPSS